MSFEYNEIVKSIFLYIKHDDVIWDYKIEVYKKYDCFYSLLSRKESFDIVENFDRIMVSEYFYVDKPFIISGLENRPFKDPNECLNFALEQLHSLK